MVIAIDVTRWRKLSNCSLLLEDSAPLYTQLYPGDNIESEEAIRKANQLVTEFNRNNVKNIQYQCKHKSEQIYDMVSIHVVWIVVTFGRKDRKRNFAIAPKL